MKVFSAAAEPAPPAARLACPLRRERPSALYFQARRSLNRHFELFGGIQSQNIRLTRRIRQRKAHVRGVRGKQIRSKFGSKLGDESSLGQFDHGLLLTTV